MLRRSEARNALTWTVFMRQLGEISYQAYIHVLVEHHSIQDKHIAFRLIRYRVATMQL